MPARLENMLPQYFCGGGQLPHSVIALSRHGIERSNSAEEAAQLGREAWRRRHGHCAGSARETQC
jgi:hypothetical protein